MRRVVAILPVLSVCGFVYIATTTRPENVGPAGMLLVFILLYLFWASIFLILAELFLFLWRRFFKQTLHRKVGLRPYYVASILAFIPVLILAIQSVNQISLRDLLLVAGLVMLAIFYVVKRT